MADNEYVGPPPVKKPSSIYSIGKKALIISMLCITAMILLKYYKPSLPNPLGGDPTITHIPKELHINYIPAEYNANVDEEDALVILSNPNRYRRDFLY